jgi:hypothetical protein
LRPKTKPPRISTRRFRFLVEPWGIEPQTSRVRSKSPCKDVALLRRAPLAVALFRRSFLDEESQETVPRHARQARLVGDA